MEVTVQLLENAMTEAISDQKKQKSIKFLIDEFPHKMDQALKFEEAICPAKFVLFYNCPEDLLKRRLLERGEASGRADDNPDSIRKRFRTFADTSMPIIDHYQKEGRVVEINARDTPEDVYRATQGELLK
jgi:UMP-CMP kinase